MNKIRPAIPEDVNEIKKIMDEGISQDYYSEDDILEFIERDNYYLLVSVSEDDKPLAAMFCIKGSLKDMCELERIPYPDEIFSSYNDDSIAVVYKTAATYISERRHGHVDKLFNEYNNIFNRTEHDLRIGLALILPDGRIPIKHHVDDSGFKPKKIISSPWSHLKSYCSYCKNDYCQCNGMIYLKEKSCEKK